MQNVDYLNWLVDRNILYLHHAAMERGYFRRTIPPRIEPYHGRFGTGYKVHRATHRTTIYHIVQYYIWTNPEYEAYRDPMDHSMCRER